MSPLWTKAEVLAATDGTGAGPDWSANGVSIDTRTLQPGDIFVALRDVRDGHDFVADALAKGAAAALVSRVPENVAPDAALVIVEDVQTALEALGRAGRARTAAQVIGVTGSAGKTSTKEMLLTVLAREGRTHASVASYNNHWGVPLTLARLPADAAFAVIEIGMNHPGEIAPLASMARPHVTVITTVAAAHLEAFENVEGIAREKAAIMSGLVAGGTAIIPGDIETSPVLAAAAAEAAAHVVTFGTREADAFQILSAMIVDDKTAVEARFSKAPAVYKVGAAGVHFARNALAVFAVTDAVGGDVAKAMCSLSDWAPPGGRGFRETIILDPVHDELRLNLIDDAFNANPASIDAALSVLGETAPTDGMGRFAKGRRVAVLGDMLELGPSEADLHRAIADHPAMPEISVVHCVGPRMRHLWNALPDAKRGRWAETAEELAAKASILADAGDVVLVKGSKSSRVSKVVDAIRKLGHPPAVT